MQSKMPESEARSRHLSEKSKRIGRKVYLYLKTNPHLTIPLMLEDRHIFQAMSHYCGLETVNCCYCQLLCFMYLSIIIIFLVMINLAYFVQLFTIKIIEIKFIKCTKITDLMLV